MHLIDITDFKTQKKYFENKRKKIKKKNYFFRKRFIFFLKQVILHNEFSNVTVNTVIVINCIKNEQKTKTKLNKQNESIEISIT